MKNEFKSEIMSYTDLCDKYVDTFFKDLTEHEKKRIYFNDYMWHSFIYGKIPCIYGLDAIEQFKKRKINEVYIISKYDKSFIEMKNLTCEKLLEIRCNNEAYGDCYVVDKNFKWTFIYTHNTKCEDETNDSIRVDNEAKSKNLYYIGPFFKSSDNSCNEKIIDNTSNDKKNIVIKKFKSNKYKELIDYCLKNSDYFSLTKYNDSRYILTKEVIKFILNDKKVTKEDILNTNIDEMVSKLSGLYKNNIIVFKAKVSQQLHLLEIDLLDLKKQVYPTLEIKLHFDEYIKKKQQEIDEDKHILDLIEYEKFNEEIDNSGVFNWVIKFYKYDCFTSAFLEKYKNKIYLIEEKYGLWGKNDKDLYTTTYKFKIGDETKKILLQDFNDIYDWSFPDTLEDLCFYRNDDLWFSSISHEQECLITPKDKTEEEYIKSISLRDNI